MNATAIDPSRTAEATRFDVAPSFIAMVKRTSEITKAKLKPKPDRQGGAFFCLRALLDGFGTSSPMANAKYGI
jgi:hypothetical protein